MTTTLGAFNGDRASLKFHPSNDAEKQVITNLRNGRITDAVHINVAHWVESTLERQGHANYNLLEILGTLGEYFVVKVGRSRGI